MTANLPVSSESWNPACLSCVCVCMCRYAELQSLYRDRIDSLDAECGKERKKLLTLQEQVRGWQSPP